MSLPIEIEYEEPIKLVDIEYEEPIKPVEIEYEVPLKEIKLEPILIDPPGYNEFYNGKLF